MDANYSINNVRWLINGELSDSVKEMLDSLSLRNHNLINSPNKDEEAGCIKKYEAVRNGCFKKVLKYTYNQESFYIKHYKVKNAWESIKSSFSISKAQKEWNHSLKLIENNLLTAKPVAVGERRSLGMLKDCYIISKAIPNIKTVYELLTDIQQSLSENRLSEKNILLKNLISYVRMVHDKGIFHGELHAENILADMDNVTLFYLIDLVRTKFKKSLSLPWRIYDISRLLCFVGDICTNEEIKELIKNYDTPFTIKSNKNLIEFFLRRYPSFREKEKGVNTIFPSLDERDGGMTRKKFPDNNGELACKNREIFYNSVLDETYRIKKRLWRSRTGKCLKNDTVFKIASQDSYTINMRSEWDVKELIALINKHIQSTKEGLDNVTKLSHKIGITCIPVSNKGIQSVCIKEYKYPSSFKRFLYSFYNSPARNAWFAAHGLLALNFLTPKPIALLEEKRTGVLKKSFIIMEDVSPCLPCNKYLHGMFHDPYDKITFRKKERFISCLATSFRQLHESGVYHGDLKANNIMVMEKQDTWDFFYVDLDRVCFYKKITTKKRIKNLSQLNASIPNYITYTDRLRFYRVYSGLENFSEECKHTLRSIIQLSIQRKHFWSPGTLSRQISQ